MGQFDPNKVPAKTDPMDAIKSAQGTYKENTEGMSQKELIDYSPKAPDPQPFVLRK